jgi:hypothetical protein
MKMASPILGWPAVSWHSGCTMTWPVRFCLCLVGTYFSYVTRSSRGKSICIGTRTLMASSYNLGGYYKTLHVRGVQKGQSPFRSVVAYQDTSGAVVATVSGLMLLSVVRPEIQMRPRYKSLGMTIFWRRRGRPRIILWSLIRYV